jgi:hypothetical protein
MPPPDCPFCGHANPTAAKFCNECGSPLHLTPCGDCGAVNNLAEAHCWRCGKVLLQRAASPAAESAGIRHAVPTQEALEEELVALEHEIRDFSRAPAAVATGARSPPEPTSPAGAGLPARQPPRAVRRAAIPKLDEVVEAPRRWPSRAMASAAVVGVVALAVGVGAYLHSLGRPAGIRGPASLPAPAATAALPVPGLPVPEATQAPPGTPPEARVVREVQEAAAALTPADAEPGPKAVDEPIESRSEGKTGDAPAAPVAAAAHGSGCPPAVAAMVLCDWVGDGKR